MLLALNYTKKLMHSYVDSSFANVIFDIVLIDSDNFMFDIVRDVFVQRVVRWLTLI